MTVLPLTIAEALAYDRWRADPVWPTPLAETRERLRALVTAITEASGHRFDGVDGVLALAGIPISSRLGATLDHAASCEAARVMGARFVSAPPPPAIDRRIDAPPKAWLRSMARTVALNGVARAARALISPRAVAVAHNELLRDVAARGRGGIGFRHAANILAKAHASSTAADPALIVKAIERVLVAIGRVAAPDDGDIEVVRAAVTSAANDLAALARADDVPDALWIATGGAPASRAIAIETSRRGGTVTGFDHGGCTGMFAWNEGLRFGEFRVVNRFVTMTEATARLTRPITDRAIVGHDGDPSFAAVAALPARTGKAGRPKVLYPLGPFYGFRQWFPPLLPDPVYLVFLDRVAKALVAVGIEATAKPRPGGPKPHPIEAILPAVHAPFEEVLGDFDVVLFDDVHSSTFWKTLQTDRGVVLLDLGLNRFAPEIEARIDERVIRVPVREDDRNIPAFDHEALGVAIRTAAAQTPDGTDFRRLFSHPDIRGSAVSL